LVTGKGSPVGTDIVWVEEVLVAVKQRISESPVHEY